MSNGTVFARYGQKAIYPGVLTDRIGGRAVEIEISPEGEIASVRTGSGDPVDPLFLYWFAWQAFHPDTSVYRP